PGHNGATWNLDRPDAVLAVHRAYVAAGAEVVLTNTFQANARAFPDDSLLSRISSAGVALARKAGSEFVLGDVGPVDSSTDLRPILGTLAQTDGVLFETFSSPESLRLIELLRRTPEVREVPILLSLAFRRGANELTFRGHSPEWFAQRARDSGIDALGVNCGREISIADCAVILGRFRSKSGLPLFARPNAGTPLRCG